MRGEDANIIESFFSIVVMGLCGVMIYWLEETGGILSAVVMIIRIIYVDSERKRKEREREARARGIKKVERKLGVTRERAIEVIETRKKEEEAKERQREREAREAKAIEKEIKRKKEARANAIARKKEDCFNALYIEQNGQCRTCNEQHKRADFVLVHRNTEDIDEAYDKNNSTLLCKVCAAQIEPLL